MNNTIYQKIVNPSTGRKVNVHGKQGKGVIDGYINHLANISQMGGSKSLSNLSDDDIKDIIKNAPPGGRWNKNEVKTLAKLNTDKLTNNDYMVLYNKVWNSIDSFMKVQNTKCNPNGKRSGMINFGDCWNSNAPLTQPTGLFSKSEGHILGNPGQSAVTDYCSYLLKNTAEREIGKGKVDFNRSQHKSGKTTQHFLGENSECSTLCTSIQAEADAEVKQMAIDIIKMLSENPNTMEWKKYESHPKWNKVINVIKSCSNKCPINLLNNTCGYIIKNQGIENGVPLSDLCEFQSSSPTLKKACNISDDLWLDTINLTRAELCKSMPDNPKCYGSGKVASTIPLTTEEQEETGLATVPSAPPNPSAEFGYTPPPPNAPSPDTIPTSSYQPYVTAPPVYPARGGRKSSRRSSSRSRRSRDKSKYKLRSGLKTKNYY